MKTFATKHGLVRIKWTMLRGWTPYLKGQRIDCGPIYPEILDQEWVESLVARHLIALEEYEKLKAKHI